MKNLFLLSILVFVLASCAVKKDYKRAKEVDSIQQYNYFLMMHPDSKYAGEIRDWLESKQEDKAWARALRMNKSQEYKVFMNQHLNSKYYGEASKRYKITLEEESWENADRRNSIEGYNELIKSYPSNPNKKLALARIEELTWKKAQQNKDYSLYLNKYPNGTYAKDAVLQQDKYDWESAKNARSITSIDLYLSNHPTGLYWQDAEKLRKEYVEDDLWYNSDKDGTIPSYRKYLSAYPKGKYAAKAQQEINRIQAIESAWTEAKKKNTIKAYQLFVDEYHYFSYKKEAKRHIAAIEQDAWNKAKQKNTIAGYRKFIDAFPNSSYGQLAEEKIIDLEVAAVFAGDHGQLPPMQKTSYGRNYTSNDISIKNDTPYTLTVLYSSPQSQLVVLRSGASTFINLSNGYYRIAANVNAANVTLYAGTENLAGGEYTSSFYISTSTHGY